MHDIRCVRGGRDLEIQHESMDDISADGLGAGAEEGIKHFAAQHGYELMGFQGFSEVDGDIRRGDDFHTSNMAIYEMSRDVELAKHAERKSAAAGLGRRWAALEQVSLDATSCQSFGGRRSRRATADDGRSELAAEERCSVGFRGGDDKGWGA